MKAVVQRTERIKITIDGSEEKQTGRGLLVLLGVHKNDTDVEAKLLADKISNLRIFCDDNDKMNLSLLDISGEALVVSNFTLFADCSHGRRPSFFESAPPEPANNLYEKFVEYFKQSGIKKVETGKFGADMDIDFINHGPVTIILDTDDFKRKK